MSQPDTKQDAGGDAPQIITKADSEEKVCFQHKILKK